MSKNNAHYWLGKSPSEKTRKKISKALKGRRHSKEHRKKVSLARAGSKNPSWGMLGAKAFHWLGGKTPYLKRQRNSKKFKKWRMKVFERDNFTCQFCGVRSGKGKRVYLEAHHIKSFTKYPKLRFDINNGVTLCRDCHKLTRKQALFCRP